MDVQTVWQCSRNGVAVSHDGGETWEQQDVPPDSIGLGCRFISFLDGQVGWVAASGALVATADGGLTWTEVEIPEGIEIRAISLRTPSDGYILDNTLTLHVTGDGGESWTSLPIEIEIPEALAQMDYEVASDVVRFFDDDHGVIVLGLVGGGESRLLSIRTDDGGRTWEQEDVPAVIGALTLTHDARFLTVTPLFGETDAVVLEYQ